MRTQHGLSNVCLLFCMPAELDRLRVEVHGLHMELSALQLQSTEKDGLLTRALADAEAADAGKQEACMKLTEASR